MPRCDPHMTMTETETFASDVKPANGLFLFAVACKAAVVKHAPTFRVCP
jgi:hypothetical protein